MSFEHQSIRPVRLGTHHKPIELARASRVVVLHDGWLSVRQGRAWITRQGEPDDWVVEAGKRLPLVAGADLLVGPWDGSEPVTVRWERVEPDAAAATGVLRRGAARALHGLAARLSAAAHAVEAVARRAQGAGTEFDRCAA
ncbi:MAG: DUF2917 domain-containing protein [Burkholderiaceae bacterium]|jgi:hypothetical protein|nr:DUF2917 domain-containing protein [Aquabacterium sp.]NUP84662.1 DUF2917 domain-containing protein [Burkholderiaceae bacterium]